jgi:hypothetical protein
VALKILCVHWGRSRFYLDPNRLLIGSKYVGGGLVCVMVNAIYKRQGYYSRLLQKLGEL